MLMIRRCNLTPVQNWQTQTSSTLRWRWTRRTATATTAMTTNSHHRQLLHLRRPQPWWQLTLPSTAFTLARASTKLTVIRSSHLADLQQTALSGKACGCSLAVGKGHKLCLDNFSKAQLMELYCEAQGPVSAPWSKGQVLQDLHKKL